MIVGITFSAFDLLHAGHVAMLEDASKQCDYLIVGLHIDPSRERTEKNKPVQSLVERQLQLRAVKWVDEIITYETEEDLVEILEMLPIDLRIIGSDYKGKDFTGKAMSLVPNPKMGIYYHQRNHSHSSTALRNSIYEAEFAKQIKRGNE